jgi:hypothetical protein
VRRIKITKQDFQYHLRSGTEVRVLRFVLALWADGERDCPASFLFGKNEGGINLNHSGTAGWAEADLCRLGAESVEQMLEFCDYRGF